MFKVTIKSKDAEKVTKEYITSNSCVGTATTWGYKQAEASSFFKDAKNVEVKAEEIKEEE